LLTKEEIGKGLWSYDLKTLYIQPIKREIPKVDCEKCSNNKTAWCGGCERKQPGVDNFDFYRPIV